MLLAVNINMIRKFLGLLCKHVDLSTFSFHPIKSITTCEGGAITTNNKMAKEFRYLFHMV